jgi:iron complex transport system ATP-binding protein
MPAGRDKPAVRVDGLRFSYGEIEVIEGLTFDVPGGEILGVIGRNGCGKTTLLRLLTGWLRRSSGTVEVFGQDVERMTRDRRAKTLSLLTQIADVSFEIRVADLVLLGRAPYLGRFQESGPDDHEIIRWAMELSDVWDFRNRSITELSAGERQRVMIARTIAQDTPVLFLDEPTSALDIAHRKLVMENLFWLRKKKGKTILLVTHDVNLTGRYADRVLMIAGGKRVAWGPCSEVIDETSLRETFGVDLVVEERHGTKVVLEWENGEHSVPWNAS